MPRSIFIDYLNPLFLARYARPGNIKPDERIESVNQVNAKKLEEMGVKAIIFDADNTLCSFHGKKMDENLADTIIELKKKFTCIILSNTDSRARVKELKENFTLPVADPGVKKPREEAFQAALDMVGAMPGQAVMVGDRLLTDIAGANDVGIYSIKVSPLHPETEPVLLRLARVAEDLLLKSYIVLGLVEGV